MAARVSAFFDATKNDDEQVLANKLAKASIWQKTPCEDWTRAALGRPAIGKTTSTSWMFLPTSVPPHGGTN